MGFGSILFTQETSLAEIDALGQPACFVDLNLDQTVATLTAGREEYELAPFFYRQLTDLRAVVYRQEVLRDIEDAGIAAPIEGFAARMREMRARLALARKLHYALQKQEWFLEALATYIALTKRFAVELNAATPQSEGLLALCSHLLEYVNSSAFGALANDVSEVKRRLSEISYCIEVDGNRVRVDDSHGEIDYGAEVLATFAKFRQGAVKNYLHEFHELSDMNHVEAQVLELVARLNPEVFAALAACCKRHNGYLDPALRRFDREVQFYLAYRDCMAPLRNAGLRFCHPQLCTSAKQSCAKQTFDIALASKLVKEGSSVVCNDWRLDDPERIFVISGPNQGGKTTFARAFGQLHYLASLGCAVPGSEARLMLADQVFTHFEKQEDLATNRGKLEDDLARVHTIIQHATARSVVVMNESFSSTALRDALYLGEHVIEHLIGLGTLAIYVTFVDELASLDEAIVSATSSVDAQDPVVRTFKVVRKAADGRAYAIAIARKHGLTYERLKEHIAA